ncbi:hypothetical protein AAEX28_13065 [Lentisphaerota bacterium WC36G]|nr:hypothetical protein LJT99_15890 [Lentisphaerae bacterium WC36]
MKKLSFKKVFFLAICGAFSLTNFNGCANNEDEKKIVDYKEYPKLERYKLLLTLESHKVEVPVYDENNLLTDEKDYRYLKDFTFNTGDTPIFGFRVKNLLPFNKPSKKKKRKKLSGNTTIIVEWRKKIDDNVIVYYRKANSQNWIQDSETPQKYGERLSLVIAPQNVSFVGKKINFIKDAAPGVYFVYAKLNLNSVDVKSSQYKIIVK